MQRARALSGIGSHCASPFEKNRHGNQRQPPGGPGIGGIERLIIARMAVDREQFQRAIELEPRVASFHYHLGVVKGEAKQPAAARAALTKALEIDARMPEAQKVRQLLGSLPAL